MKILFLSIVALVTLFLGLSNQWKKSDETVPRQTSLLWKIEGNGMKSPSYLFGTMHLIQKEYFHFPSELEKIVKKSDILVMELGELPDQMAAMKYMVLTEGTLMDYFDEQQADTLFRWAEEKLKMNPEQFRMSFDKFKPFVVIQTAMQMQFIGKTESYEMKLMELAKEYKIEKKGLETIAEQMSFFDNLSKEQQTEMVMSGIRNEENSAKMALEMQKMYKSQRIDSLYMYIQSEGGVLAEEQAKFLDNRNRNWIPQIKEVVKTKKAFIAVGAGHLGGENGVIRLLEKEGYKVTPVKI